MRIGIATSGGDCAGLNAGIAEAVARLRAAGAEPVLIPDGFAGLHRATEIKIDDEALWWASRRGGSILGASRTNLKHEESLALARAGIATLRLDGLVVFGGDGSLQGAGRLATDSFPVAGIPKTIDADVGCTEQTIGFATAVQVGCEAVEHVDETRWTHKAAFLVEVMGRRSGMLAADIARAAGVAGVLVPEVSWTLAEVAARLSGPRGGIVVVSESAWSQDLGPVRLDERKKPQVGDVVEPLAAALQDAGVSHVRTLTLGHLLRGGPAVAADRLLARRFAAIATAEVLAGRSCVAAVRDGKVVPVPVEAAFAPRRFLTAEEIVGYRPLIIGG